VDAIGLAGQCSGAVLCAEFSGVGVATVARRFGRGGLRFSSGASESWLVWVGMIGQGARQGWHGIGVTMPCKGV
jgi:hypothetical protein